MDFKGQALAERYYQYILLVFSLLSFVVGYSVQSFKITFYIFCVGVLVACAVCVPDWGMYKKNPVQWRAAAAVSTTAAAAGSSKSSTTTQAGQASGSRRK
ncbi:hypothetical protein QOT17_012743 [Balamuthia mandrillaris]